MDYIDKLRDSLSLRGNIPGLVTSSMIEGTAWQMHDLVWQPYILSLGGSMPIIGSFISLWTLITCGLQFLTGELCDSVGRKPLINWYFITSILGITIALFANNWILIIPSILLYSVADSLGEPSYNPIFAESVDAKKIGLAFSLLSLTWFLPGLYSKLFAGYLGDNLGLRQVLFLVLGLEIVAFLVHYFTVKDTLTEKRKFDINAVITNLRNIFKPRSDLKGFYTLAVINRISWTLAKEYLSP
ncbi:MAG: MFS transporter [Candidatus Bathyarchaeota archaeon]|nr:MFS transporter [Candidatus Bathyarchaeota archaeon]